MQLIKEIKNYIYSIKINRAIKKAKFVHVMYNDKFNKPFVDFLNRNFNKDEHIVLCKKTCKQFPFPEGDNVYKIPTMDLKYIDFTNVDKIICHSLFDSELVNFLYNHKNLLKEKAYWVIWGGDLYNAPRDEKNDYVRSNFKGYISDTDGDCEIAKEKYNSDSETINAGYTFPITKEMLDNIKQQEHTGVNIQINNSCDKSTLEMLDILSKFKDENIKVRTILSYGQMEYKESIIQKGTSIFGNKFEYLDKYLLPQEYAQYSSENDILILNQNRQQGLGNSFVNLALGCKLFIKSDITTYNHFNSKGIKVFDTYLINKMSFNDFINYPLMTNETNIKKSLIFFDEKYLRELWERILVK